MRLNKALMWAFGPAIILAVVAFAISVLPPMANRVHYQGKTIVTGDQYAVIASQINFIRTSFSVANTTDGWLCTYDFYASTNQSFPFLQKTELTGIAANPVIHSFATMNVDPFSIGFVAIMTGLLIWCYAFPKWLPNQEKNIIKSWRRYKYHNLYPSVPVHQSVMDGYSGLVAVRSWKCNNSGVLKSIVQDTKWKDKELTADKNPTAKNIKGVYAYRLGASLLQRSEVCGIVEMRGKWEHHPDGVIRAENCRILCLFISDASPNLKVYLESAYRVPVLTKDTALEAYLGWLFSTQGQMAMNHNLELAENAVAGGG